MITENFEKYNCRLFDSGRFNDIALAYLVTAMKIAKTPHKEAGDLINAFAHAMDDMTAEEALERYRGN